MLGVIDSEIFCNLPEKFNEICEKKTKKLGKLSAEMF